MEAIKHYLDMMAEAGVVKYIISNPFLKSEPVRKINVEKTL